MKLVRSKVVRSKIASLLPRSASSIVRNPMPGFDPLYYQYWYRDVLVFRGGPMAHYLHHGWREGRDPSAGFSTNGYLRANPDVEQAKLNPLIHFLEFGLAEGRTGWQKDRSAPPPAPTNVEAPMRLLSPPRRA